MKLVALENRLRNVFHKPFRGGYDFDRWRIRKRVLAHGRKYRRAGRLTVQALSDLAEQWLRLEQVTTTREGFEDSIDWIEARVNDVYPETVRWRGQPYSPGWESTIK